MIKVVNLPSLNASLKFVTDFCKGRLQEDITIIVPDKLSLFMEKHVFESLNLASSFNLKVSTLDRFVKKNCAIDKQNQISKLGSIVLVHKILMENSANLSALRNKAYSFSYAEEIFATIAQLKASKITCQEMQKFKNQNTQLENKIKDLALVYEQYEANKAGMLDLTDQFLLSCLQLNNQYDGKTLLLVGFDDFTAVEYTAIEQLAQQNTVMVVNYFAKSNNQHIYNDEVFSQLKQIAYINELNFETLTPKVELNDNVAFLQANLFGLKPAQHLTNYGNINIFSARDIRAEIEHVARDIRFRVLNGAKYGEFGVAIFGLENVKDIVKEIFKKYEINAYIDAELTLNQSVLYKFVCDILRFNLESYELSHLIDIINSPFFACSSEDKIKLILKLVQINFKGKITNKLDLGDLNPVRDELIEFLSYFELNALNKHEIVEKFKNAFTALQFDTILNTLSENVNILDKQILLKKSQESILNLFDEIEKFYPSADCDMFADIFLHAGEVVKINNLPLTIDTVKVVDANNFCEIFDNLYFINCTAENAPQFKNDCGIILDSEIENLNFAHKLAPTIAHINKLARLRLVNTCLLFKNSLTISYSRQPSELIKDLCAHIQFKINGATANLTPQQDFLMNFDALSQQDFIEQNLKFNTKKSSKFLATKTFNLNTTSQQKIDFDTISPSRLEDYFKCPFHHFLNYTLKVRPRLKPDIMPLDTGNILHEILFNYYKAKKQVADLYEFAKKQIFSIVEKDDRLKLNAKSPVLINLIEETVRVLNGVNYIDQNSNFQPKYLEYPFYDKTSLNLGNVKLTGKIDRVDTDGENLRIIDYKTGRAEASLKELYYGNKLQLFLYALAMENVTKKRVLGEFYLPLHNAYTTEKSNYALTGFYENTETNIINLDKRLTPGAKSDIVNIIMGKTMLAQRRGDKALTVDEMQHLKTYAKQLSKQAVDEIKSGFILPTPSEVSSPCDSCPYNHICLKDCNGITERKAQQVNTESFSGGVA